MARKVRAHYDVKRLQADLALRGWNVSDLARVSGKSNQTIARFLSGETQTAKTAAAIARALGFSIRRYFSHVGSTVAHDIHAVHHNSVER